MWGWLKRDPDFIVGHKENPYLLRWYLIPQNRFFNIYLHKFLRDDDDRALHDHPWPSLSVLLKGRYDEMRFARHFFYPLFSHNNHTLVRVPGKRLKYRSAGYTHRVLLKSPRVWTLFITGPQVREWGFHCPKGWVPWQEFCDETDHGNIGRGCE